MVRNIVTALAAVLLLMVVGCSSSDSAPDGDLDTADATEEVLEESVMDGDVAEETVTEAPQEQELADTTENSEAVEETTELPCADFAGLYTINATCSESFVSLPEVGCVMQQTCSLALSTWDAIFSGEADGGDYAVSATDTLAPTSCEGAIDSQTGELSLDCVIPYYSITCAGSLVPLAVTGVTSTCCDPLAQDCADAADRCQLINVNDDLPLISACIGSGGSAGLGEVCTRPTNKAGYDTCQKGLYCTYYDCATTTERRCAAYCQGDDDCPTGKGCLANFYATPRTGMCITMCDLFGDASECPAGGACALSASWDHKNGGSVDKGFCTPAPSAGPGGDCGWNGDCPTGYGCYNRTCEVLCSAEHPCAAAGTDCAWFSFGGDYGVCLATKK